MNGEPVTIPDADPHVEMLKGFITAEQVSRMLGRAAVTVQHYRLRKGLPYVVVEGDGRDSVRFRKSDVIAWARKHGLEVNGTS